MEDPKRILQGMVPPGRIPRKEDQCQRWEQDCLKRHPMGSLLCQGGLIARKSHREEISSGRNWLREAGTQPTNHPQREQAVSAPGLPPGPGSQQHSAPRSASGDLARYGKEGE